jgi:hypothetical protein
MKGISSHTIKLDQEITYTDARKIKDFTKNFKENDRLKIDRGIKTFDKNGVLESNFSATFTKTNNTKLTNLIHKFEKLKNAIFINKSFFHKANSIENIFNHSSISVKKLNNLASEITVPEDNEDMEKSFAEHNKIVNPSDSSITGQKFSQEENKINSITASDKNILNKGNKDLIDDEYAARIKKADEDFSRTGEAEYLIAKLRFMGIW